MRVVTVCEQQDPLVTVLGTTAYTHSHNGACSLSKGQSTVFLMELSLPHHGSQQNKLAFQEMCYIKL